MDSSNQPAFPVQPYPEQEEDIRRGFPLGLTKREYFAAMAMQALIQTYPPKLNISENEWSNLDIISHVSCKLADQLLTQLNKVDHG